MRKSVCLRALAGALAAAATVAYGSGALAATDTANLSVSATVLNACAIGPGTLNFGTTLAATVTAGAGTLGTTAAVDADSGATVEVVCTNGASATVTGGLGANASGSTRRMKAGASDYLTYELYTSAGRSTVLDTTTGSIAYTGTGSNDSLTVYGRITGANLAAAKAGSYSDTVLLTITYTP